MTSDINSPFNWHLRKEPSIFANDVHFKARKDGKSNSEVQSEAMERKRVAGEAPGTIPNLGSRTLSYKQFGTNVKNGVSTKKPNKHEA